MSNPQQPASAGQVISFPKSPGYWRRRAEQHRKRGEHHRAVALLRHAVALDPASGDLRMEYARSLRDISCYEASTREASRVLAFDPTVFAPYRIIGRNMLSLGREQEAIDAFSHYLERAYTLSQDPVLYADDDEFYALEDLLRVKTGRGRARLDALCRIGSLRLARGDLEGAGKALGRAECLHTFDERLHTLSAMLFEARSEYDKALAHALIAVGRTPHNVTSLCTLAGVRYLLKERGRAAAVLMKTAFFCRFPHEEQLYCYTAASLRLPELSLVMLRLSRKKNPDRLPTLFNCAIALLQMGRMDEALAHLHRCLDLDPEDLAVDSLFHTVQNWKAQALPLPVMRKRAMELASYPFLPAEAIQYLMMDIGDMAEKGMEVFATRLFMDGAFYRSFLYALSIPATPLSRLIFPVATAAHACDPAAAERLLRDILIQSITSGMAKRYALSTLVAMGIPPPYVVWQDRRILQITPPEEMIVPMPTLQRHLTRRILLAQRRVRDPRLTHHALALIFRMSRRCRCVFAADRDHVWTAALLRHFALTYGYTSWMEPFQSNGRHPAHRRLERAFAELCALMPLNGRVES